jgi:hypothetical protein
MATALRGHAFADMPTEAGGHGTRKIAIDEPPLALRIQRYWVAAPRSETLIAESRTVI